MCYCTSSAGKIYNKISIDQLDNNMSKRGERELLNNY